MIGFKAYRTTPTTLDLNGPILSYIQQPVDVNVANSTTLVGIATALPVGTGSISYQWYETGYGPVSTSSTITGTATTALSLTALNYNDTGRKFYLQAGYDPSAYGTSDPITAGTARSTGNAINEPLVSDTVELTVGPDIVILQQPSAVTLAVNNWATFSVLASVGSSTGAGVPSPCIAVIDETDPIQNSINNSWTEFRNKWPTRPFHIFKVYPYFGTGNEPSGGITLPSVAPTDYQFQAVQRDEGIPSQADNWFNHANLNNFVPGTTVTLWIDESGSMTKSNVQASYDKFVADCAAAGILIEEGDSGLQQSSPVQVHVENYIWPFIDELVGTAVESDPNLFYQWKVDGENAAPIDDGIVHDVRLVQGVNSRVFTIKDRNAGIHTVACSVSYPGANNTPLLSNAVNYEAVAAAVPRSILHVEEFDINASLYSTRITNLEDEALEINPSNELEPNGDWNRIYSIHAPEEDVAVKVTLAAAAGQTVTGDANPGGQPNIQTIGGGFGGLSSFELTLTQGQEYVVNIGAAIWPSGGNAVNNGGYGGGGSFFYQGGELLVACGGGGGGSAPIFHAGALDGMGAGQGEEPVLGPLGWFPGEQSTANTTEREPGQVASCTIGDFWANEGIAPCASIGSTTFFTGKDGQKSTSIFTNPVIRGYKAGLNYQFNGGNGSGGGGGGGAGAAGGRGGNNTQPYQASGGLGFDGIGNAVAQIPGNTQTVGYIKIEKA